MAKYSQEVWKKSYAGKNEITRKALSPLKQIYQKLVDLIFIEPRVEPVAELIQAALDLVPKRGVINGDKLLVLQGVVSLLSDTNRLLEHAQQIMDGRSKGSVLNDLINHNSCSSTTASQAQIHLSKPQNDKPKLASHGLW